MRHACMPSLKSNRIAVCFCQQRAELLLQVVGHTIQDQGINSACQEQVYRIDVGLSKGCGNGSPEVSLHAVGLRTATAWLESERLMLSSAAGVGDFG